ncbi:inositol monophosphatase family protein [Saccharicrinis sp. FJH54]|uniref:inositol monophosphatase family protein n=1 Tax=Saccharicrinis sp. FJH54 TaxID=3344665 RepID=UPI0035D42F35
MDYKSLCDQVVELVRTTGSFIMAERKSMTGDDIEAKGKNDFVTRFDKLSEKKLVSGLSAILPEAGFIAEEGTSDKKGEVFNWIIDPIDGTTNFMHASPPFSISVALQENDEIVIGVVLEMFSDECFYSWKGGKVYINNTEVSASKCTKLSDALIATGFPYKAFGLLENFMASLIFFMEYSHGVRRLGSAAMDLAYVAAGRYDAFYEYNLNPWDVAAGAFLVQQAGGKVSDFRGTDDYLFGKEMVAATNGVYPEFFEAVSTIMNKK